MKESATIKEMMETANFLASNASARKTVEDEVNSRLTDEYNFYIDEIGIGHMYSRNIHISSKTEE